MFNDCVNFYADSMHNSVTSVDAYFKENELMDTHQRLKSEAVAKVCIESVK